MISNIGPVEEYIYKICQDIFPPPISTDNRYSIKQIICRFKYGTVDFRTITLVFELVAIVHYTEIFVKLNLNAGVNEYCHRIVMFSLIFLFLRNYYSGKIIEAVILTNFWRNENGYDRYFKM
jgi:hypothetical protein